MDDIIRTKWRDLSEQEKNPRVPTDRDKTAVATAAPYTYAAFMTQEERLHYFVLDHELTRKLEEAIKAEPYLSTIADSIQLSVEYGIVTLDGIVFTELERMIAEDTATILAGSGKVNNYLVVI